MDREVFLGRRDERARFAAFLTELARAGQGPSGRAARGARRSRVVLVHGLGGSGKTKLLEYFQLMADGSAPDAPVRRGQLMLGALDWALKANDPAFKAGLDGPGLVAVLDAVRQTVIAACGEEGRTRRRAAAGFDGYVQGAKRLPDPARLAEVVAMERQAGSGVSGQDVAALLRVAASAGLMATGNPAGVAGLSPAGVAAAAQAGARVSAAAVRAVSGRSGELAAADYDLVTDPAGELARRAAAGIRVAADAMPLVVFMDEGQVIGPRAWGWLRQVMVLTGPRVAWVIGGRFETEAEAGASSQVALFVREIGDEHLVLMSPAREQAQAQDRLRIKAQPATHSASNLTAAETHQLLTEAVASVQTKMSTWTRADLIRHIGEALPARASAGRATLESLADHALSGRAGEAIALLSAPEWPGVPDSLRRSDGESVFRPHGAERYASQTQLTLEEQLKAQAQATGAPRLDPDTAAQMIGADRASLEAHLQQDLTSAAAMNQITESGLRMDQAAAAFFLLTSPRRAEVMIGPPGTGKTRTAVELARIWNAADIGPVVALTTSSNARNVIRDEATRHQIPLQAYNTAEWLGHCEHPRESRRPIELRPGALLALDEASMMSLPDLAAILRRATLHDAKVIVTGDPMQLHAVESGGGMTMLARTLGHVQLSEAGRFCHAWEAEASLRLRDGDVTALTEYRQHGRLHAGYAEDILEDAARAYLRDRLNGEHTLLMTGTDAMAAELARRVRGDLIAWGLVSDGPAIALRDDAQASARDWIMARKNNNQITAGQPGRTLANRDILRITSTEAGVAGLLVEVQRLTGRDTSGREQWSAPFLLTRAYLRAETQLAYAVTFHAAEGQTVDSGIAVFTGEEDRQAVTVALTRGRNRNEARIINGWRLADPAPGTQSAAELARFDRLAGEAAGQRPDARHQTADAASAEVVLGQCLARDGQQLSATDTRDAAWSDADRLDVLGVQWQHVVRDAAQRLHEAAVRSALTETQFREVMNDPAATWLWRSLREAEAAGLDAPATLRRAVASGPLEDAESIAKVVDWRIRQHIAGKPAVAARPWLEQVPETGNTEMDRYACELAAAMDDRQQRLSEHAAEHQPAWTAALGPLPDHPLDRAAWEHRAGQVAAYREMWGWTHPREPIGPRPGQHSPEACASWQAAAEALGYQPGSLREHSDGKLHAWRSAFEREMAWAPPYKGDDLATVRAEIRRTQIEADRARRNAEAATGDARQRLADQAAALTQWEAIATALAAQLADAQNAYEAWERATAPTRDRAVAADAELRRRHPDRSSEPLQARPTAPEADQPAPPTPRTEPSPAAWPDLGRHAGRFGQIADQLREISERLDEAAMNMARQARERAAEITSLQGEPDDPDAAPVPAWKSELAARQREAVRHEPMPRVPHAEALTTEVAGLREMEAAD